MGPWVLGGSRRSPFSLGISGMGFARVGAEKVPRPAGAEGRKSSPKKGRHTLVTMMKSLESGPPRVYAYVHHVDEQFQDASTFDSRGYLNTSKREE